ncbi:hypothetical protein JCM33774_52840 [Actinophytocola sp. KF-1]
MGAAKWFALAATYVMNTWSSWAHGSPAGVVLHSVPPLLVFVAAEAVTDLRDKLSDAVTVAVNARVNGSVHAPAGTGASTATGPETAADESSAVSADGEESGTGGDGTDALSGSCPARRRRGTFAAYREAARRTWRPGVVITPAWIREVTGCSRGLSSRLAASLSAELVADRSASGEVRA